MYLQIGRVEGHLGHNPELRYTTSGQAILSFDVASTRPKTETKQEVTTWFKVVAWAGQATYFHSLLTKGSRVYVEGEMQIRKWKDKDDREKQSFELHVFGPQHRIYPIIKKNTGETNTNTPGYQPMAPEQPPAEYDPSLPF